MEKVIAVSPNVTEFLKKSWYGYYTAKHISVLKKVHTNMLKNYARLFTTIYPTSFITKPRMN